jgi:rhamnosyltransferase
MKISGVAILYHPNVEEVLPNIRSYIDYIDALYVFANSNCSKEIIENIKAISPKISFIQNQENEGIAKPLNKAVNLSVNEFDWLLTMDQDSYFEPDQASAYFNSFNHFFSQTKDIAVVCPNHSSKRRPEMTNADYKEIRAAITSGSLINTKICKELNGFEEKLFIDYVDFEYCYRCFLKGDKIIQFHNIYPNHSIGTQKRAGYFSVINKSGRSLHSPFRVYYIVRNFLYVSAKYRKHLPQEMKQKRKELFVLLKNNLLFSGKFFGVLAVIIKGWLHFKLNKFSS